MAYTLHLPNDIGLLLSHVVIKPVFSSEEDVDQLRTRLCSSAFHFVPCLDSITAEEIRCVFDDI